MQFKIEQIAIHPTNSPEAAKELLQAIGADEWIEDQVSARGLVQGVFELGSTANLSFNYSLGSSAALEFEVLEYQEGANWIEGQNRVSHLGMHCTEDELSSWREFFEARAIGVAQEVVTQKHTNPAIAGKRRYRYVIFDTHPIIGVDLKFIVRLENEDE